MRHASTFRRESRKGWAPLLGTILTFSALVCAPLTAEAGWDGNADMVLGQTVASEIVGAEAHTYHFTAPAGTLLNAAWKIDSGNLVLNVELFMLDGTAVPLGAALNGTKIKKFLFAATGDYYLQFSAASGAGEYTAKTKGKFPKKFGGKAIAAEDFEFGAMAGASMSAKVKPSRGSAAANPTFDELVGRFGDVPITAGATLKNIDLPFSGSYDLAWILDTAGPVDVKGKVKFKAPRRAISNGPVDPGEGATIVAGMWGASGHADVTAEAFIHWDEDGEIRTSCARCHSSFGFQDFVGADGSADNHLAELAADRNPDAAAPLGSTVDCDACHSAEAAALDTVIFPSGQMVTGLGPEARCMQCHQGRESTISLDEHIAAADVADDDTVDADLRFRNIHYFAAGATLYGGGARGGYQYDTGVATEDDGRLYDGLNPHVPEANTCVECHDKHSLERVITLCDDCHVNAADAPVANDDDLRDIRMAGSPLDYNGNGDLDEGMYYELMGLGDALYATLVDYTRDVAGDEIAYDSHSYPYFFSAAGGGYSTWTARALRAAYNYQYWQKDPGALAHNPKYVIQLLYDSIGDLIDGGADAPANWAAMHRSDEGHFDGQAPAFRHWDNETDDILEGGIDRGTVQASCQPCHAPAGFDFWAKYGINPTLPAPVSDGLECGTCHVGGDYAEAVPALKYIAEVEFPGGTVVENDSNDPDSSFICLTCHKGRESMITVDERFATSSPSFRNIHYFPAGVSIFGAESNGGYEFGAKATYWGKWAHAGGDTNQCNFCHLPSHTFEPQFKTNCAGCHPEAGGDITAIRRDRGTDYNGVGGTADTTKEEVESFGVAVYAAMQAYTVDNNLDTLYYDDSRYPYFWNDPVLRETANRYGDWDADLAKAAFNYQYFKKEPGAWAHNTYYVMQILYDTIDWLDDGTLNASAGPLTRPAAP